MKLANWEVQDISFGVTKAIAMPETHAVIQGPSVEVVLAVLARHFENVSKLVCVELTLENGSTIKARRTP